jgi:rod shape-determining protein MreC
VIDKGSDDGIGVDMPVIDEGGLVGRVIAVTGSASRVKLITDPTLVIAVRVERTGETGVLKGRGSGPMALEMFNTDTAVVEGDLLVTADGRFPAGIPVARVLQAARADVGFALRTEAEPTAELTRVDFIRVLVFTRDEAGVEGLDENPGLPVPVPGDVDPAEGETEDAPSTTTIPTTTTTAPEAGG